MYTLRYPDKKVGDPFAVLETGLGAAVPKPMQQKLRALYLAYVQGRGAGCHITADKPFRVKYGAKLRAAYKKTYEGKPLFWLRTELLAVAGNRCPSCGGARPVTLDHHLAQTPFPEFAIFPLNLIAMCGPCNQHKSASTGKTIATAFIHPYLDQIPTVSFFAPTVTRANGSYTVSFTFTPAEIPDAVLAGRMARQLKRVDFNKALLPEVGELLNELALRIEREIVQPNGGVVDQPLIEAYLHANADRIEEQHRVGFWQAIMSRALANDAGFCSGGYRDLLARPPA
jgi:hypothetical protein